MPRDPRDRYDDLIESAGSQAVEPEELAELREEEVFQSGWVAAALARDDEGRVLFVHEEDYGWVLPGGTVQPGETLEETVRREVLEETGIEIEPERPHAVGEWTVHAGEKEAGFTVVLFAATVADGCDREPVVPGKRDDAVDHKSDDHWDEAEAEALVEARFVEELPDDLAEAELTEAMWERVVEG